MKLFENIAEYQAFKRKYELMGQLEEERLRQAAKSPEALRSFFEFMDEMRSLLVNPDATAYQLEDERKSGIERQQLLARVPRADDDCN